MSCYRRTDVVSFTSLCTFSPLRHEMTSGRHLDWYSIWGDSLKIRRTDIEHGWLHQIDSNAHKSLSKYTIRAPQISTLAFETCISCMCPQDSLEHCCYYIIECRDISVCVHCAPNHAVSTTRINAATIYNIIYVTNTTSSRICIESQWERRRARVADTKPMLRYTQHIGNCASRTTHATQYTRTQNIRVPRSCGRSELIVCCCWLFFFSSLPSFAWNTFDDEHVRENCALNSGSHSTRSSVRV